MAFVHFIELIQKIMWDEALHDDEMEAETAVLNPSDDDIGDELSLDDADFDNDMDIEAPSDDLE